MSTIDSVFPSENVRAVRRSKRFFSPFSLALASFAISAVCVAQQPSIFVADDPSGSLTSRGANIAYLRNSSGSDVTLTLDGNTITTKANHLNIFDRSSGSWVLKAVLDEQAQTISPTPAPGNNFRTGLYSYFKLDETSGGAIDSFNGRNLAQAFDSVGSGLGIINTSRSFPGNASFYRASYTDFAPGGNHIFATFWAKAATLNQQHDASFVGRYNLPNDAEWLVWCDPGTKKVKFSVSADGTAATAATVSTTIPISDTINWYFFAVGWDGTNIKISMNGGPYATVPFAGPVFSGNKCYFDIGCEAGSDFWTGQIDEVAVWIGRNDLTISDVQQLYNNGAGLPFSSFQ